MFFRVLLGWLCFLVCVLLGSTVFAETPKRSLDTAPGKSDAAALISPVIANRQEARRRFQFDRQTLAMTTAVGMSTIADVETTRAFLDRYPGWAYETNWFFGRHPGRARLYAQLAPETFGSLLLTSHLRRKKKTYWWVPGMIISGVHLGWAINNIFLHPPSTYRRP